MNIRHWTAGLIAGSAIIAGTFLWCGCDTDSASEDVVISPESVVLQPGQTATFTASGGYDYTWSLEPNDGSGTLNSFQGNSVIYTCMSTNIGSMPKKVKVVSTIEGTSSGGSSNSTPYSAEAFAEIFWPSGSGGGGNVSISYSGSANVATNGTKVFTASGGTPPYTWTVSSSALGSVSPSTGNSTTYTASGAGTNTITVTDSTSQTDSQTISQP